MKNPYVLYHSRKNALFHGAVPHHSMSMGQLWGALAPQGYNLYPTAGYVLAQLDNLFICGDLHVSTKFSLGATTRQVGRNALSMRFFGCFIARCTIIVRPIAYKSHSTPFLNRPHDLTPVSWVYTIFECKDIGLAKRLLGYCFWLLGSGLTADSDDIIKAACQYE